MPRTWTAWLLILCSAWLDPAPAAAAARRRYGSTLKAPRVGEVRTTDPALAATPPELEIARQVHETLYRQSSGGALIPVLAQDLPRTSGAEWTVVLRPGLRFHDGSALTTDELVASWERLLRPQTGSPHWWLLAPIQGALEFRLGKSTKIAGLEKPNALTLRIRLVAPMSAFGSALTAVPTAPLPAAFLTAKGKPDPHPAGCGPFAWASAISVQDALVLEAFLGHPQGRPYLDRILFVPYPSQRAAALAFELEELHVAASPPSRGLDRARVVEGPRLRVAYLGIQPRDLEQYPAGFREAIAHAVDRQSLATYLVGDRGFATDEMVAWRQEAEAEELTKADPRAAKEFFLRLAMQKGGLPPMLTFLVEAGQAEDRAVAERIQLNLVDAGAVVSVVEAEGEALRGKMARGEYDLLLVRTQPLVHEPELQLIGLVAALLGERELQPLLAGFKGLPADDNRVALVREMARRYQLRFPWIPLFQVGTRAYLQGSVREAGFDACGLPNWAGAWLTN